MFNSVALVLGVLSLMLAFLLVALAQPSTLPTELRPPAAVQAVEGPPASVFDANTRSAVAAEQAATVAWWQLWLSMGASLALLVTLHYTRVATRAAQRAVELTKDEMRANALHAQTQMRAYVLVDRAYIEGSDSPSILIDIKNSGQTPAFNVRTWHSAVLGDYPLAIDLRRPDGSRSSPFVLAPGQTVGKKIPAAGPLSAEAIRQLDVGAKAIYAFGEILYEDAFKQTHFTRFRLMYGGDAPKTPERYLAGHDEGNSAD